MDKIYLKQALAAIEPKSKAAKVRELMPLIEQKRAEGVSIAEILAVLNSGGLELTEATLKSYLQRNRKKKSKTGMQHALSDAAGGNTPGAQAEEREGSHGITNEATLPVSMQDLDRVMKPDPWQQSAELARYEHQAKHQRRSAKS